MGTFNKTGIGLTINIKMSSNEKYLA